MAKDFIRIGGAREHNLKNLTLDIPRDKLVVITGLSGSGKSSLAFDTIYAEGQRKYVESLSAYARQFLDQLQKPDVDFIDEFSFGELRSRETLMPRIIDRSSGRELGRLSELEYGQLMSLFEESWDDELPAPIDPDAIERLAESGASPRLMAVVMQILQGGEDFDVGWEPD